LVDIIIKRIQEWTRKYSMFFSTYRQPDLPTEPSLNANTFYFTPLKTPGTFFIYLLVGNRFWDVWRTLIQPDL